MHGVLIEGGTENEKWLNKEKQEMDWKWSHNVQNMCTSYMNVQAPMSQYNLAMQLFFLSFTKSGNRVYKNCHNFQL